MTIREMIQTTLSLLADVGVGDYAVEVLDKVTKGSEERLAACDISNKRILLSAKLSDDDRFMKIARHEVAHALSAHEEEEHGPDFHLALEIVPERPTRMDREFRIELAE